MNRFSKAILFALLAVSMIYCQAGAQNIPSETWMGMYFGAAKIGHARFFMDKADFEGKPGYKLDSTMSTKMLVLGTDISQTVDSSIYLDLQYAPVYQTFKMASAGHSSTVTARFESKQIVAEMESSGTKTVKKIPIPPGSKIIGDSTFLSPDVKLQVGDKMDFKMFNPLTLALEDVHTEVVRKEFVKLADSTPLAFVIKSVTLMGEMLCWQDENGEVVKAVGPMGITMIRESKEVALGTTGESAEYTPPSDLAVMTSVRTQTEIPDPRAVSYVKVRVTGLADKSLAISDSRQKVTLAEEEPLSAEFEIKASEFQAGRSRILPIRSSKYKAYLADTPYVETSNPEIVSTAKQIVGSEKNAYKAVSLLRAWVHGNMRVKGDIGIMRSSVDILHSKEGVCRDYAVLYTTLARSAGVPTRLVAGLVFWEGGFYYHAWAESFVGEWIPVDATLPTDFVDATHIKLAEGDSAMFDMVKTMGVIKAEVEDFR